MTTLRRSGLPAGRPGARLQFLPTMDTSEPFTYGFRLRAESNQPRFGETLSQAWQTGSVEEEPSFRVESIFR